MEISTRNPAQSPPREPDNAREAEIKILDSTPTGSSTRVVIQSNRPLIVGNDLYAGAAEIPLNIGTLLSKSGELYYYSGTVAGHVKLGPGDIVKLNPAKRSGIMGLIAAGVDQQVRFAQKYQAEVTAVQGDFAMIDKGTLQQVHERDMYRIFDGSGTHKGTLEIRGIGDLQSSGRLYRRWYSRYPEAPMAVGDQARFVGQRRLLGLGVLYGFSLRRDRMFHAQDLGFGVGAIWNVTFWNGWGLESVLGLFQRTGKETATLGVSPGLFPNVFTAERSARFILPTWVKRSFFYDSNISPFAGVGFGYLAARHVQRFNLEGTQTTLEEVTERRTISPMVGGGIEFFPARFFRPRVDIRHFFGPRIWARGNAFKTESTFVSFAILTAW